MKKHYKNLLTALFFLFALLLAGSLDYQEAKETEQYWKVQTK